MIIGGNVTVFVANMDASLKFYSEVLGLKVSSHYGDHWASVEAGSFTIGLHRPRRGIRLQGHRGR
jgi:catechol 2,3-dioxygenase-like lactoylglutathione lyase family enzyme